MNNIKVNMISSPNRLFEGEESQFYLQVDLEAGEPNDVKNKRPNFNLSLVIDKSGSMRGEKMDQVKLAACHFVENLRSTDIISIIVYDDAARTIITPQMIGKNKKNILSKINRISIGNMTALYDGTLKGISSVFENYNSDYVNRVILFSDGLANVGLTGLDRITSGILSKINYQNISVTTMGVGQDFDEVLMQGIASATKGNYYYIENPSYISTIVERELTGLQNLLWRNLSIEFTSINVRVMDIYGYKVKGNTSYIGDIRALDELYVMARCIFPYGLEGGNVDVILRFDDLYNRIDNVEIIKSFKVKLTNNINKIKPNYQILANLELFNLGETIDNISNMMKASNFQDAILLIEQTKYRLEKLKHKNPKDERIKLKISFLNNMKENAQNRAYSKKFAKMSSYYSYSASRQNYRKKITDKYGA